MGSRRASRWSWTCPWRTPPSHCCGGRTGVCVASHHRLSVKASCSRMNPARSPPSEALGPIVRSVKGTGHSGIVGGAGLSYHVSALRKRVGPAFIGPLRTRALRGQEGRSAATPIRSPKVNLLLVLPLFEVFVVPPLFEALLPGPRDSPA